MPTHYQQPSDFQAEARAQLARMIEDLGQIAASSSPLLYLDALDSVRSVAVASGADLLADVLGRLESDLFGAFQDNSMRQAIDAYQEWIDLALDAAQQDAAMREALFAAMAVRRGVNY